MTTEDGKPDAWQLQCAAHLKRLGPALFDQLVLDLAENLHSGWPALTPEEAAEGFLESVSTAAAPPAC